MSDLKIITNLRRRRTLDWSDLTAKEQSAFDYLDTEDLRSSAIFVRYRGSTYDLGEFMRPGPGNPFGRHWTAYHSDSFFSGVLFRFVDDGWGDFSDVIMGRYYS